MMNFTKKLLQLTLFCTLSISLLASQEVIPIFLFSEQLQWTNPALINVDQRKAFGLLIDSQWLGKPYAPKQQSFFFESQLENKKLHFGSILRNRSSFAENNLQCFVQFNFPIQLNADTFLHLGLQAGGDFYKLNFDNLSSVDGVIRDPVLQKQMRFIPNTGIGFHFQRKNYFLHASLPRLLERYAFKNTSEIFLPNRLHFAIAVGHTFNKLSKQEAFELAFP